MQEIPSEWLFPTSLEEAAHIQYQLAQRIIVEDDFVSIHEVGGTDVSNNLRDPDNKVYAAVVSLVIPSLQVIETACEKQTSAIPYKPGFLAFREIPALVRAFEKLTHKPDLLFVDGHGISHPRGLGIASHLGVLLDCPTVGVAKSILVGKPSGELGLQPGSHVPLIWKNRNIGICLRTKSRTNPLYISTGHKISLPTALSWVLTCLKGYRLPEPTRQAHLAANRYRQDCNQSASPRLL